MPYNVYPTTAENVIGATDAALQKKDGIDKSLVAQFLGITEEYAHNALCMARELGSVSETQNGLFILCFPYSIYLVTSVRQDKAAILRLLLEVFEPYKTFKVRLALAQLRQLGG